MRGTTEMGAANVGFGLVEEPPKVDVGIGAEGGAVVAPGGGEGVGGFSVLCRTPAAGTVGAEGDCR